MFYSEKINRLGKYDYRNIGIWLNLASYDFHSNQDSVRNIFHLGLFPIDAIENEINKERILDCIKNSLNDNEVFMVLNAFSTFTHEKRHFIDFHSTPLGMYLTGQQLSLNLATLSVTRILKNYNVTSVKIPFVEHYSKMLNELSIDDVAFNQISNIISHIKKINDKIDTLLFKTSTEGITTLNILEGLAIIQQHNIIRDSIGKEYADFFLDQISKSNSGKWYMKSIEHIKKIIPGISLYSISLILYNSLFGHINWQNWKSQNPPKILSGLLEMLSKINSIKDTDIKFKIEKDFNLLVFGRDASTSFVYSYKSSLNHIKHISEEIDKSSNNSDQESFYLDLYEKSIEIGKLYYSKFFKNKKYFDSLEFGKDSFLSIPVFIESDVGFVVDPDNAEYYNPIIQYPMSKSDVINLPYISYAGFERINKYSEDTKFWQIHLAEIGDFFVDDKTKELFREMLFSELIVFGTKSFDIVSLASCLESLVNSKIKIVK